MSQKLVRMSVSLEEALLKKFDLYMKKEGFPTRSEAIKLLIHEYIVKKNWINNENVAGTISIVYDHHKSGIFEQVISVQHQYHSIIISTQHVHLDHDNCFEIIIVRGKAKKIMELNTSLKSIKGITHNNLTVATS